MEGLTQVIAAIPASALPLVVVIVAVAYLFFKYRTIERDRTETKAERDKDSSSVHDDILKLKFDVTNLQGITALHRDRLESIDKQLSLVNQELVKLNIQVEHLANALREQNEIMKSKLNNC